MSVLGPNKNVPAIPQATPNMQSVLQTMQAVTQGVQSLGGARGDPMNRAVTFNDLVALGLISAVAVRDVAGVGST